MKKSEIVIYHSSQSQKRNVGGISDKKPNPIGKQIIQNTFKATKYPINTQNIYYIEINYRYLCNIK